MLKTRELNKTRQAKGQLKKLAQGKYHNLMYELTDYHNGDITIACRVYIHGYEYRVAPTWDEALQKMREQIREA